jgi:hypothetical protein
MAPTLTSQMRRRQSGSTIPQVDPISPRQSLFSGFKVPSPFEETAPESIPILERPQSPDQTPLILSRKSLKRALSSQISRVGSVLRGRSSPTCESPESPLFTGGVNISSPSAIQESSMSSDDVAGPRFQTTPRLEPIGERTAGDPAVYDNITVCFCLDTRFLR